MQHILIYEEGSLTNTRTRYCPVAETCLDLTWNLLFNFRFLFHLLYFYVCSYTSELTKPVIVKFINTNTLLSGFLSIRSPSSKHVELRLGAIVQCYCGKTEYIDRQTDTPIYLYTVIKDFGECYKKHRLPGSGPNASMATGTHVSAVTAK